VATHRLPARLHSVAIRDSARAGTNRPGKAADAATEMRTLVKSEIVKISAPGPLIVSCAVKVVLLCRLHLDSPFLELVMGRAED
jgi:hypothetical protein